MSEKTAKLSPSDIYMPTALTHPPGLIHDSEGRLVGVILSYADYQTFLRILAAYADWESLPPYLQDAIDNMLADEALAEEGPSRPFRELLAEAGELHDQ